jgi:hypothetical protein
MNMVTNVDLFKALQDESSPYQLIKTARGGITVVPRFDEPTAVAFLRAVLPSTAFYGIATVKDEKGNKCPRRIYAASIEELAKSSGEISRRGIDVYFAVASFVAARGEQDAGNVASLKCFKLDIDGEEKGGYATLEEASLALDTFLAGARLPDPWIILSGYGLHCYFPLTKEITPEEWLPYARGLKSACERLGFKADPVVTADPARILRCPGTINWRDPQNPKPVTLEPGSLKLGPYPLSAFAHLLNERGPSKEASAKAPVTPTVYDDKLAQYYASALNAIADADSRKTWLDVGMAVHALGWGDKGYELWTEWSKRSAKFDEADQRKTWESFKSDRENGITIGTLIHLAKQAGWDEAKARRDTGYTPIESRIAEINRDWFKINNYGGFGVVGWFDVKGKLEVQKDKEWAKRYDKEKMVDVTTGKPKIVKRGTYWLEHTQRREYESVALEPGGDAILPGNILNTWRGFGAEPRQGDWHLMQEHIRDVLANGDEGAERYILNWAAWAAQNPGRRAEAMLIFKGKEGTGKGVFLEAIQKIFGHHGLCEISVEAITGKFNAGLQSALFLFADEVSWRRDDADRLKSLITGQTLQIEKKGYDRFPVTNRLKIAAASNQDFVVPAGPNARRYALFEVNERYAKNGELSDAERDAYFIALWEERDNGGVEAMLYDLQRRDLGNFHPCQIPNNEALARQKQLAMSDLEHFYFEELPATVDWKDGRIEVGANPLLQQAKVYSPKLGQTLTPHVLGRFLKKHGVEKWRTNQSRGWLLRRRDICEKGAKLYGLKYDELDNVIPFPGGKEAERFGEAF